MREHGHSRIEPELNAELDWGMHVNEVADVSYINKKSPSAACSANSV
jgi:hypothetical protein